MGRKGKKKVAVEDDAGSAVWCWYCDREFVDEKILLQHQRAKHFKCPHCNKRMINAPGMAIHCSQMHKEELREVPNSIPGRSDPGPMISGMSGIPEEDLNAHVSSMLLLCLRLHSAGATHDDDDEDGEEGDAKRAREEFEDPMAQMNQYPGQMPPQFIPGAFPPQQFGMPGQPWMGGPLGPMGMGRPPMQMQRFPMPGMMRFGFIFFVSLLLF